MGSPAPPEACANSSQARLTLRESVMRPAQAEATCESASPMSAPEFLALELGKTNPINVVSSSSPNGSAEMETHSKMP